jgi:hypothetical protein
MAAQPAHTACDLLAKESAALRRDEASCLDLLRANEASDQKTAQRLQRALRNVRKQLDEVDLAHVIAEGQASAEAREDAHVRVDELESDLAAVRAELLAEKKRRQDAETLIKKELEPRLKAFREVSGEQCVTLSGGQAPHTTSTWAVPIKVRTIYVPTRPAPNDADDVDHLRAERDQLRASVDRLTSSGAAARAASRAKSARLEAQLNAMRSSDLNAVRQTQVLEAKRAAAEAEALRLDAARSGAQEELIKLKCVNEKLTQEAARVDRVRLDEDRRSAARRASESKRQQDAKKALTERSKLMKELETARRDAASARALVARERKRRTASVNGFGRDLQELRKALARVAAAVDASSMHQGRASARAARCCVVGGDDALELLSPSSEIDLGTVLDRLAAMEKQLAPSLKARALDVAALSPRKVTPTKKGLVSP